MKQIFAFENIKQLKEYENDIQELNRKFKDYKDVLVKHFDLVEMPKAIVWTSSESATSVFSNVPVPAFTNRNTIYMSPSVEEWKSFYLSLLNEEVFRDNDETALIKKYFESITHDEVFCILAHELTHHIELFPDEFGDERTDSIWFEEGMCEYLSQKLTLTDAQFTYLRENDERMIKIVKPIYGGFPLDQFGVESYGHESLVAIMLNYWRSAAAIHYLVEKHDGDIHKVFELYHEWHKNGRKQLLTEYFGVSEF